MQGTDAGDDWSEIFAAAINGLDVGRPLGIVDVTLGNTAWSAKTVKDRSPVTAQNIRSISGRNNVGYSYGNNEPFAHIQETGNQVLGIWNARAEEALEQYAHLRIIVLIRNMDDFRFKVFEQPVAVYDPADYVWTANRSNNLIATNVQNNEHMFTWQPNGSQFTIHRQVSGSARAFAVKKPPVVDSEQVLRTLGYSDDWVTLL